MKKGWLYIVCLSFLLFLAGCANNKSLSNEVEGSAKQVELMVSAASSLTDAVEEIKALFENDYTQIKVTYNFASSGKLAQQIEQGAPSDLFLSASVSDMDKLQHKNLMIDDSRVDFTANELVLIAHKDATFTIDSFENMNDENIDYFVIGEPNSVPVGYYTRDVLKFLNLWEPLQSKLILGSNVRQVLTHVEMGNADLGVVYATDAKISDQVKVLASANANWHGPIVYPGAIVTNSEHTEEAQAFLTFLTSEKGKAVLNDFGFQ